MKLHTPVTIILVVLVAGIVVTIACTAIRLARQPPYVQIVDELPGSARLVRHEWIRHGLDYLHLFEFSFSDTVLRDTLVNRWQLEDVTGSREGPISFAEFEHPDWWTPESPAATRKFGRSDHDTESYMSMWEQSATGRLYVEVGRW